MTTTVRTIRYYGFRSATTGRGWAEVAVYVGESLYGELTGTVYPNAKAASAGVFARNLEVQNRAR